MSVMRLRDLVIANAMAVLFIGLIAGVMLVFSLLDAVALWPIPAIAAEIPGTTRGWQAAHVGGILNGVMIAVAAILITTLELNPRRSWWVGWGMIITGWANTVFYWAGNVAANRGLSATDTPYGESDLAGVLAYIGGGAGMIFTFIAVAILGWSALQRYRASPGQ